MRKNKLLCFSVLLLSLAFVVATSCGSDKDGDINISKSLIYGSEGDGCYWYGVNEMCYLNDELVKTKDRNSWKWYFTKEGKFIDYTYRSTMEGTYKISGSKLTIHFDAYWSGISDYTKTYTILSLTSSELVLKQIYGDTEYDYTVITFKK